MRKQVLTNSWYRADVVFLFYFLLFSYPLVSLLWRRSYPFLTVEVGVIFLLLAVLCILLTVVLRNVRPTIVNVLSPLLITITLMFQFDLLALGVILCFLISLVVAWRLRTNFQLYSLPVLIMLIMGAYIDSSEDDGWVRATDTVLSVNSELPLVVHILLDSFIGIEGLPPYPASKVLKSEINSFFDDYDFQVFPRAYSRYSETGDSLYKAMNFQHDGQTLFGLEVLGRRQHVLRENAEFEVMEKLGYRLNVYQTAHLDFCQSNPDMLDRCWEYPQPNLRTLEQASNLQLKVKALVKAVLRQSTLLSDLVASQRLLLDQGVATHDPRVIANLKDDLGNEVGGRFYFAHVLLPHDPYAFMYDCSINYEIPLWARHVPSQNEPVLSDEVYEIRTMKYFEQVDCALNSLRQIFEEMKTVGFFADSIIVVHGDHGSRLGKYRPNNENLDLLTPTEYRAAYSTLFAVKFPGQNGRVDNRVLSLGLLLEEFSKAVEVSVANPEMPAVFAQAISNDQEKIKPYVYLQGGNPQMRVDINIFDD